MGKSTPTPNKLQQMVFQLFLGVFDLRNNISKIYQNPTMGKWLFSRWRPRWPPFTKNGHNSLIIHPRHAISVRIPWFRGSKDLLRQVTVNINTPGYLEIQDGVQNGCHSLKIHNSSITYFSDFKSVSIQW